MKPRQRWDFVVTHQIPCEECRELKSEKEVRVRSSYVSGEGWIKRDQCCQPCFDSLVKEVKANVVDPYAAWDSID